MASNFAFLHEKFPELEQLGMLAERYLPSDPQLCLMEAGLLCEGMIRVMCALDHVTLPEDCTAAERIDILQRRDILPADIAATFHLLDKARDQTTHKECPAPETNTLHLLQIAHSLSGWFFQTYVDETCSYKNSFPQRNPSFPLTMASSPPGRKGRWRTRPLLAPHRPVLCLIPSAASVLLWPQANGKFRKPRPAILLMHSSGRLVGRPIPDGCAIPAAYGPRAGAT